MPSTGHLIAFALGAWIASPFALVIGAWLGTRHSDKRAEKARCAGYQQGRTSVYAGVASQAGEESAEEIDFLARRAELISRKEIRA